jgi:sirohydrochlorin ferrochelatase
MSRLRFLVLTLALLTAAAAEPQAQGVKTGVLLLAHVGSSAWDANVHAIAAEVDRTIPTESALGMATRANIQSAVDRLQARGVTEIVAVPLFVSSHSSVITATEYLLGLRRDMPEALKTFAKMSHGGAGTDHADHSLPTEDGTTPVRLRVPVRMTPALDAHPIVASIVTSRAREISVAAGNEAVVLVAHGPTNDDVNERWLVNLRQVALSVRTDVPFSNIDAMTVRDDAPAPVRDAATRELRTLVERRLAEGRRVLIVPVLLSYGGIEAGLRTRLEGLDYTMATQALAPDPRLVDWVRAMAGR